jgi:hypothetical protein
MQYATPLALNFFWIFFFARAYPVYTGANVGNLKTPSRVRCTSFQKFWKKKQSIVDDMLPHHTI